MAFIELSCHSNTLGMAIQVSVLIPQPTGPNQVGIEGGVFSKAYPVLYLLHGLSDDHSIWARR
ncbi:MAG: esterase family protein, partial [Lentisphaeria bacterium]|nr:esterase family protein [Lentisphaeria bacterium]